MLTMREGNTDLDRDSIIEDSSEGEGGMAFGDFHESNGEHDLSLTGSGTRPARKRKRPLRYQG
jgi:hypothetical protein